MLNSIALSRESSGINSSVLLAPVAQVDRIEVIRGPGSSIYGDFAMAGVVNIITKNTGGHLHGRASDDESIGGGGQYSYHDVDRDFGLGVSISAVDDGENAAKLNTNPDEERYLGVFQFDYKNFAFTAEGVRRRMEMARQLPPGVSQLPPGEATRSHREEESWALEGRQTMNLGSAVSLDAYLCYLQNSMEAIGPAEKFQGDRLEIGWDLNWSPRTGHEVLFSGSYSDSSINDAFQRAGPEATTPQLSNIDRRLYAISLQDQIVLTRRLSATLGLRFDDYDDVGDQVTPRIAAVYRPAERHVIKIQYSEGFRAPTFWELYHTGSPNEGLDFEVMGTTELSYIYHRPDAVGRMTLYYSELDDGIYRDSDGFSNFVAINAKGVEVEWEQRIGEKFRWQANVSYNDTRDGRYPATGYDSPGIAPWLGNLVLFVQPSARFMITGRLQHMGDRYSEGGKIDGYDTLDLAISRTDLWKPGLTLRSGVKNIFDDDILYVNQGSDNLFLDEYDGRTLWLQLSYDF
jgi:iron complex outermembrane receptor protein